MVRKRDNVLPFRKLSRAATLRRFTRPPPKPPKWKAPGKSWRQAWFETRPFVLLIALVTICVIISMPGAYEPPGFLQSEPEQIAGTFTRCGRGRGYFCVIDGDTFRIGERTVRVVGIDTAEVDALCPAEAEQAELSTRALQYWLNRGAFTMTARLDEPSDRYGRELRIIKRMTPDNRTDRLSDWMQSNGGARSYLGGWRGGWC